MNPHIDKQIQSWSFFDRIYCISLAEREDRRKKAKKQFAAVGLVERVEFVIVNKHRENPEQGIFESHKKCLQQGLASGAETILIFEDDVFFKGFSENALHAACEHLRSIPSWDGLILGGITSCSRRTSVLSLTKVRYRCLAHAYALNRSFAQVLAEKQWSGIPWDEVLRVSQGSFYALYPMCAFQGLESSDNHTLVIDRTRRLLGGLPFIQRASEFYQNHKLMLTAAPLSLFIILAALLLRNW